MPFAPVTITDGQVSGVDSLGPAASVVVNWELDDAGVNIPRPPLIAYEVDGIGTSPMIGADLWRDYVVFASENRYVTTISEASPATANIVSTAVTTTQIEGSAGRITFVAGQDHVYMAGGARIQRWNDSLAATELVSGSPNCTHIVSLAQYLISNDVSDSSVIRWSEIGEGAWTSWPAANYTTAEARPDPIVGIYENLNELYVFGSQTTQVYAIGADPTLPFDVVSNINTGLAAPYACARLDESMVFLDDRRRISISDGRSVTPISDAIQKDLRGLGTISDCWIYREERGQFSHIVVRFPTEARTFVYNLKSRAWSERDYYASPLHADWPVGAYVYWPEYDVHLFGSTLSTGGILQFDTASGSEIGGPLVCLRTTGWHDHGTDNRKRSIRLRLTMRRGTGTVNTTPGALEVRVQNDDGPWGAWTPISVGEPHQYEQVKQLYLGGIFKRRRYSFRYSTTEEFSLVKVVDEVIDLEAAE